MNAREIIALLDLRPLPVEGGYYRETWRGPLTAGTASASASGPERPAGTAIYYLLDDRPDGFSAMHRLPTSEVYHFYLGDPVEQLRLFPDGSHAVVKLGPNLLGGELVQTVVPAGVWQGSRLADGGRFALLGTTMAPGFVFADYEGGTREALSARYPAAGEMIRALTRG